MLEVWLMILNLNRRGMMSRLKTAVLKEAVFSFDFEEIVCVYCNKKAKKAEVMFKNNSKTTIDFTTRKAYREFVAFILTYTD